MRLGLGLHITGLRAGGAAFDPATLFASGEQGAWYEPSPSTCFTSLGATTPASVGDAVAVMLDRRKTPSTGVSKYPTTGIEYITNGDFSDGTNNWTGSNGGTLTSPSNVLRITNSSASKGRAFQNIVGAPAGRYVLALGTVNEPAVQAEIRVGTSENATQYLSEVFIGSGSAFVFDFPGGALAVTLICGGTSISDFVEFDDISLQKIDGNHATQATLASRPILRQTGGGLYYLEFDGVDDALTATTSAVTLSEGCVAVSSQSSSVNQRSFFQWVNTVDGGESRINMHPSFDLGGGTRQRFFDAFNDGSGRLTEAVVPVQSGYFVGNASTTSREMRVNGVTELSGGAPSAPASTVTQILIQDTGAQLDVYAVIIRDAGLTASQLSNVETYLSGVTP